MNSDLMWWIRTPQKPSLARAIWEVTEPIRWHAKQFLLITLLAICVHLLWLRFNDPETYDKLWDLVWSLF